jgi:hypothetical protein
LGLVMLWVAGWVDLRIRNTSSILKSPSPQMTVKGINN